MITKLYITAQQALIDFKNDQRGVTAIEYAILGVAVAAAIGFAFGSGETGKLAVALNTAVTTITTALKGS